MNMRLKIMSKKRRKLQKLILLNKNCYRMKLKFDIDYKNLEIYLKSLYYREDIETNHNKPKNPKLIEGHAMDDIEYFNVDSHKYNSTSIIAYGEPYLVDALGNDLSIVICSRRKYKLPNGRLVNAKFVTTIIDDCREVFGTPLNGYWKIPPQFIKEKQK